MIAPRILNGYRIVFPMARVIMPASARDMARWMQMIITAKRMMARMPAPATPTFAMSFGVMELEEEVVGAELARLFLMPERGIRGQCLLGMIIAKTKTGLE